MQELIIGQLYKLIIPEKYKKEIIFLWKSSLEEKGTNSFVEVAQINPKEETFIMILKKTQIEYKISYKECIGFLTIDDSFIFEKIIDNNEENQDDYSK